MPACQGVRDVCLRPSYCIPGPEMVAHISPAPRRAVDIRLPAEQDGLSQRRKSGMNHLNPRSDHALEWGGCDSSLLTWVSAT
jgi:hypothetical protein